MAYPTTNTKERLLLWAVEQFAVKGYDGVSMRQLAEELGVKTSSLYNHYKSKEDLYGAVIDFIACSAVEHIPHPREFKAGIDSGLTVWEILAPFTLSEAFGGIDRAIVFRLLYREVFSANEDYRLTVGELVEYVTDQLGEVLRALNRARNLGLQGISLLAKVWFHTMMWSTIRCGSPDRNALEYLLPEGADERV